MEIYLEINSEGMPHSAVEARFVLAQLVAFRAAADASVAAICLPHSPPTASPSTPTGKKHARRGATSPAVSSINLATDSEDELLAATPPPVGTNGGGKAATPRCNSARQEAAPYFVCPPVTPASPVRTGMCLEPAPAASEANAEPTAALFQQGAVTETAGQ